MNLNIFLSILVCVDAAVDGGFDAQTCQIGSEGCLESKKGRALLQSSHSVASKTSGKLLEHMFNAAGLASGNVKRKHQRRADGSTTKTLGIQVASGMATVYPVGASLPGDRTIIVTSSTHQQTGANIPVMVGDEAIGTIVLENMNALALHEHRIRVSFTLDETCSLDVAVEEIDNAAATAKATYALSEKDACTWTEKPTTTTIAPPETTTVALPETTTVVPDEEQIPSKDKWGLVCVARYGCLGPNLEAFNGKVSWLYNYGQRLMDKNDDGDTTLEWVNRNEVEFVPMFGWFMANLDKWNRCVFTQAQVDASDGKKKLCTYTQLKKLLAKTMDDLVVRPKYLLAYNEFYQAHEDHKDISPEDAVLYWRKFIQPLSQEFGLELVSPVTGKSPKKSIWMAGFLKECWNKRDIEGALGEDDFLAGCDIHLVTRFAIHEYSCKEKFYDSNYGNPAREDAYFYERHLADLTTLGVPATESAYRKIADKRVCDGSENIIKQIADTPLESCFEECGKEAECTHFSVSDSSCYLARACPLDSMRLVGDGSNTYAMDSVDWNKYVMERKLWLTETNCNMEHIQHNPPKPPTPEQSCQAITGLRDTSHGRGSVRWIHEADSMERFAWWNTFNNRDDPEDDTIIAIWDSISDGNGGTSYIGNALVNNLDPLQCDKCVPTRYLPCD